MSIRAKLHGLVGAVGTVSLMTCSPVNTGADGGPTTQTGNGMVTGKVYRSDGTTPAGGAYVSLRKKQRCVTISSLLEGNPGGTGAEVRTDAQGEFAVDSVDTGLYAVVVTDSMNNYAFSDSILLRHSDSTVALVPVLLMPAGAIKGVISLPEGGDPRKVFIVVEDVNRFAHADSCGSFKINLLPPGRYSITVLPTLDNYGVVDTAAVRVKSADTADVGIILPPFLGIPKITWVTADYDTLRQRVTLRWSTGRPQQVAGYNVYRQTVDPETKILSSPIVFTAISDTTFIDSLCDQGKQYEYRITALDTLSLEGEKSMPARADIALYDITPASTVLLYDTILQSVTLRWSNPDSARVKTYNVYRRNVDLNEQFWTPFNIRPQQDTFFIDSAFNLCPNYTFTPSGATDCREPTYEYCVAAIIGGVREGKRSEGMPIHVCLKFIRPEIVAGVYDTLQNNIRLNWRVADATLVGGYAVLRRNTGRSGDAFVYMHRCPVEDTVYVDSTVTADMTYEYRIASIVDGRAEIKSEGVQVKTASTD